MKRNHKLLVCAAVLTIGLGVIGGGAGVALALVIVAFASSALVLADKL